MGRGVHCRCMELVAAGWCTRKWLWLHPAVRNLTSGDLGIPLVVIRLGVTRLKKTRSVCLSDLFEGRGEKGQFDLVCGVPFSYWVNGSYVDVLLKRVLSVVSVLWGVGPILRNGYGNQRQKVRSLLQGSEKSAGWHSRHLILAIGCNRTAALTVYPWPNG